eukprot:gene2590-3210_t
MNLLTTNGVKIYNVSAGKSLPEWLSEKKRSELKKDLEFRQRVELIQDFQFESASQRVKISPDGQYLMATGIYPPQFKIFELSQLSNKVTRNLDCQIVQFEVLSEDYSKPVFLRDDRYIEFHAKFGTYFSTRIPKLGRDMTYHKPSCDLYITASGTEVFRLNLEEGRFLAPLQTNLPSTNVVAQNPVLGLMMFGGDNGFIECWDPRIRRMVSTLNVAAALPDYQKPDDEEQVTGGVGSGGIEVTAGKFGPDGLLLGLGMSNGSVLMYDLRSSAPSLIKQHQYQLPINSINFHRGGDGETRLLSSDPKIVKAFDINTGKIFMTLEPKDPINDVLTVDNSGLLMMPGNTHKIQSYYVPALGPAPRWCSFLDNLTEELEEDKQLVYEDYKFITRDEVHKLNIENLIGTGFLKASMHGYFIHIKLYNKILETNNPFNYEEYKARKVEQEIKQSTSSRIKVNKNPAGNNNSAAPKVNAQYAKRIQAMSEIEEKETAQERAKIISNNILHDERFKKMFDDEDFAQDEESTAFKLNNPRSKIKKLDTVSQDNSKKTQLLKSAPFNVRVGKEVKKVNSLNNNDSDSTNGKVVRKDSGDLEMSFIPTKKSNPNNKRKPTRK